MCLSVVQCSEGQCYGLKSWCFDYIALFDRAKMVFWLKLLEISTCIYCANSTLLFSIIIAVIVRPSKA